MTFTTFNLHPALQQAISACGYTQPTPVQAQAIPIILSGKDVLACAQTGTGKTAAFVLPALQQLSGGLSTQKPRVLILTPTRELAAQITQSANKYGKFLKLKMVSLVGGMSYHRQIQDLSRPVDVVVATPGRLLDHLENRRIDLSNIQMLVLDEADRMLDMGFIDDVKLIAKSTPKDRQTLLFSATFDQKIGQVAQQLLKNPTRIDLATADVAPTRIQQMIYLADDGAHKMRLLQHLLSQNNLFKAIIFSATKANADRLAAQLCKQGHLAAALHGDLKQNARNRVLGQFRNGKIQFLVATDVAARGIDVSDISHVINYDLPKFSEDYVHRIGRTGRAGKEGIAISLVLPMDRICLQKIERHLGETLTRSTIEGLEPSKQQVKQEAPGRKKKKFQHKRFSATANKKPQRAHHPKTGNKKPAHKKSRRQSA